MAVVYFTSNASTGAGSLVEAIANAQPGDVVRPDESLFERGSTIEIVLASRLAISKNVTLDASPFRVILDGGSAVGCVFVTNNATAEFTSFDFVRGKSESGAGAYLAGYSSAVFNRCLFAGCDATYGGAVNVGAGSSATLNDCAVVGCRGVESGGGVLSAGALVLSGVTAAGCVSGRTSDVSIYSDGVLTARNSILGVVVKSSITPPTFESCIIDVASSQIGFVAPPDDLTVENWNANAWQNWDLRLLDDASGAPSPYRDSGDVGAMSRYDLDGNFRGRETNGVATCSPGAYETIQADLFWIGRDATGAEVVSPSFLTSDGWAASRFATVAGDVAPSNASSLFVGANVAFADVIDSLNVDVAIGGERRVEILPKSTMRIGALTIGASANIEKPTTHSLRANKGFRLGINVAVEAKIQVSDSNATNWSDVNTAVLALDSYSLAPPEPYYTTLRVGRTTTGRNFLGGAYECETFETIENAPGSRYATNVEPGTSIRCRTFNYVVYDAGKGFTNQVVVKLYGEATAKETRAVGATLDASDDFVLDVTDATSATLTLNGQTVYGDAPTCAVSLTGSARIDERGLTSQALTLNADAALNVDGGRVCVDALTLGASSLVVSGGRVDVESLTVADGASVSFSCVNVEAKEVGESGATASAGTDGDDNTGSGASNANAGVSVDANGKNAANAGGCVDAVLTATESATVGAASFVGVGYFATPSGTDSSAATFAETVRRVDVGANVETFAATATGPTTARLEWSATDATARVCVERENAAAPGGWETIAVAATAEASPLEVALSGRERFRIFDGQTFRVDAAWFPTLAFFVYVAQAETLDVRAATRWEIIAQAMEAGPMGYRNEGRLFKARIRDALNDRYLTPDDVESITATLYKVTKLWNGPSEWTPVSGCENFAIDAASVLEKPTLVDGWTLDEIGPNVLIQTPPNMFPEGGEYRLQVTFRLTGGLDPVVATFEVKVK